MRAGEAEGPGEGAGKIRFGSLVTPDSSYYWRDHTGPPSLYPLTCCWLLLQYLMQSCARGGTPEISALARGAGLKKSRWQKRIERFPNRFHKVTKNFWCKVPEITSNVLPHTLRRCLKCSRFRRLALRSSLKCSLFRRLGAQNSSDLTTHVPRVERTHANTTHVQLGVALHSVLATTIAGVVMCVY